MVGIIVIFALAFTISDDSLMGNIANQNTLFDNNDNGVMKASAATVDSNNTDTKNAVVQNTSTTKNEVKTTTVVVKSTKMTKKEYNLMTSTIKKYEKANKGAKPNFYNWQSKSLKVYKKDYNDAIKRHNAYVKKYKKAPSSINIYNAEKTVKVTSTSSNSNSANSVSSTNIVKSTKMTKKEYNLMTSTIKKFEKANKGAKPNFYTWKAKSLKVYKKYYLDTIKRYNAYVKKYKKAPTSVNIFNGEKIVKSSTSDSVLGKLILSKDIITTGIIVKSIQMNKKQYDLMVSTIKKFESANKGVKPDFYTWEAQSLIIYQKDYLDAIDRYGKYVKSNKKAPTNVNIFNAEVVTKLSSCSKSEPMVYVKCFGAFAPFSVRMNSTHIEVIGARATSIGGTWYPAGLMVFENRLRLISTGEAITGFGVIKINPKKVEAGEFTVFAPNSKYHDVDLCMQTGLEKMFNQRYFLKRLL